ncbi:MAG: MotA/TolQ/ExbB proton channel family protein [Gammaproteobacteria bacterium]|nr:MotA/TolQ/ExbB proton channel family protein [Gammaproteobacteria bacterium]NNF62078.1 hypothetical protein [Gammaproteobacteria bacterium]NNM20462.1 hypothetical protein [Gammaproteobacteria bacterium]
MKPALLVLLILASSVSVAWQAPDVSALSGNQQARDADRLEQQRARLAATRAQLRAAKQQASRDERQTRELESQLAELTATLEQRRAALVQQTVAVRDVYTTARQTAGDLIGILRAIPTRPPPLETDLTQLATSTTALDLDALAGLWEALHVALTSSATQSQAELPVQTAPGELQTLAITRVGHVLGIAPDDMVEYDRLAGVYRTISDRPDRRSTASTARDATVPVTFLLATQSTLPDHSVLTAVRSSGPIGLVIVLLGLLGLVVLALRLLRLQFILRSERVGGAGSASQRLRAALRAHQDEDPESVAGWLNARVRREARHTQWGHGMLTVIIGVAPLLGLLGTVTGMIVTFHSLRIYGSGDPVLMADGVSQALSTTLLGLAVAIPLLLGQRWLLALANSHIHKLDSTVPALIAERHGV